MKVFISWSGETSHHVALAFRDWLPSVIQTVEPYVSSEDIDKGARWSSDISSELEASVFGIICVTASNIDAPWVNFEAGALSKFVEKSRVTPFLFRMKRSEVKPGPLLQFQSTLDTRDDIHKMVESINSAMDKGALDPSRLNTIFDVWWPRLEERLSKIRDATDQATEKAEKEKRSKGPDLSEEVITLLRQQSLILNDPTRILPPSYVRDVLVGLNPKADTRLRDDILNHPAFDHLLNSASKIFDTAAEIDLGPNRDKLIALLEDMRQPMHFLVSFVNDSGRGLPYPVMRSFKRKFRA